MIEKLLKAGINVNAVKNENGHIYYDETIAYYIGQILKNIPADDITLPNIKKELHKSGYLPDFFTHFENLQYDKPKAYKWSISGLVDIDNDKVDGLLAQQGLEIWSLYPADFVNKDYNFVDLAISGSGTQSHDPKVLEKIKEFCNMDGAFHFRMDTAYAYSVAENKIIDMVNDANFINHAVDKLSEMMAIVCAHRIRNAVIALNENSI